MTRTIGATEWKSFASSCVIRYFKNYSPTTQREDTNRRTSSMATARTETTRGPTYSMTRAIWATPCKKVSSVDDIVCVATIAHSQWKSLVTWTDLSYNGHVDGMTCLKDTLGYEGQLWQDLFRKSTTKCTVYQAAERQGKEESKRRSPEGS